MVYKSQFYILWQVSGLCRVCLNSLTVYDHVWCKQHPVSFLQIGQTSLETVSSRSVMYKLVTKLVQVARNSCLDESTLREYLKCVKDDYIKEVHTYV